MAGTGRPTEVRPHAHPMPGYAAVVPVDIEDGPKVQRLRAQHGNTLLEVIGIPEPGMAVGIVVEIGTLPSHVDQDEVIPYPEGATVYYPEGNGIRIGDYVYVPIQQVVAWDDPPNT